MAFFLRSIFCCIIKVESRHQNSKEVEYDMFGGSIILGLIIWVIYALSTRSSQKKQHQKGMKWMKKMGIYPDVVEQYEKKHGKIELQ